MRERELLNDLLFEGCIGDDGECFFCGGQLELLSCPNHPGQGCFGYSEQGQHEDDCPYVAAKTYLGQSQELPLRK